MRLWKREGERKGLSDETMRRELRGRLEPLRVKPYRELQELPEWSTEDVVVEGIGAGITVYREGSAPDPLEIVVQFATESEPFLHFFESSQVVAEGFRVFPDGTVTEMLEQELYGWM
ncbi:MAG: hypothetical protein F9K18_00835 [Thermoanaerobaculia bacterium]|nr:MAG: hypothetical protein F9K18_00835 [Thermoanaerobaculia bacterium]